MVFRRFFRPGNKAQRGGVFPISPAPVRLLSRAGEAEKSKNFEKGAHKMGLIKAALGAAGGVMADQWKEYFYCEAIPENVMAVRGLF